MIPTVLLRNSLTLTTKVARTWFENRTTLVPRADFEARGRLSDDGNGAVYVYINDSGNSEYVGQTGRKVKARLHDETSKHKDALWWPN